MNNKQIEVIASYGIYCLNRQEQLLRTYCKIRREYWELAIVTFVTIVAIGCAIASIVCATMELFDGWAAALVFILDGISAGMFIVYAKVTADSIHAKKTFIAERRDINNTLTDITDVINLLEDREDDTAEDEQ